MITPDILAKTGSEHGIQAALFAWIAVATVHGFEVADLWASTNDQKAFLVSKREGIPALRWIHAIPNGGSRGDTEQSRKIRGATLKAEGVRDGVSDIFWPLPIYPFHGLYIEMKTPTGRVRPSQTEFGDFVRTHRYAFTVERSWLDAANVIKAYHRGAFTANQQKDK